MKEGVQVEGRKFVRKFVKEGVQVGVQVEGRKFEAEVGRYLENRIREKIWSRQLKSRSTWIVSIGNRKRVSIRSWTKSERRKKVRIRRMEVIRRGRQKYGGRQKMIMCHFVLWPSLFLCSLCVRHGPKLHSTESFSLAIITRITLEIELFTALNCSACS